jgi:putative endonuclease
MSDESAKPAVSGLSSKALGNSGERIARAHLERLGWQMLATGFRCAQGEMDIIAMDGATLVFVEVKTRRGKMHGTPVEAVDARKQSKLVAIAQAYLAARDAGGEEPACRFDIAEVFMGPDGLARVHLRRAAFGEA